MTETVLYDYWRSSASYRVRIALQMLGLAYRTVPVDLLLSAHKDRAYLELNPQGLVPCLRIDGQTLTQSLAIIEYLAETRPESGFLPDTVMGRQRARALSYAVAMDIHPICNLNVASHVVRLAGDEGARTEWMITFISSGLQALERLLDGPTTGRFCLGDAPTMADFCLVPQVYNAHRWGIEMSPFPRVTRIADACNALPAFTAAHPDAVKPV
ncbi:maleylacetoacetate isomerase [Rhizobium sp. R72]|uniref:maleylacetoacetate isomerase n=1 Tax=unclassified Rhizobium TaxID=2613769 RepID=UPI000B530D58|nr:MULTISPECIES: maleylacetoacetate isomerase [unclassified Rhizobium]OWW04121.1 maleylacetoacetate isomerase [Rhizobium sp. R72]OWW04324.1 maleylacetoacetate isomerase [Rhizobium sp. R711]